MFFRLTRCNFFTTVPADLNVPFFNLWKYIFKNVHSKVQKIKYHRYFDFCQVICTFLGTFDFCRFICTFLAQCHTCDLCHFLCTIFAFGKITFPFVVRTVFLFIASTFKRKSSTKVAGNIYCSKNAGINYPIRYTQRCTIPLNFKV